MVQKAIAHALNRMGIQTDPNASRTLRVQIVNYKEQSASVTGLRWFAQFMIPGTWAFHTSNALDLNVRIVENGKEIAFTEFGQTHESARNFPHLVESMANRIAVAVFTIGATDMPPVMQAAQN